MPRHRDAFPEQSSVATLIQDADSSTLPERSSGLTFLYLDQAAVLKAGVLDMCRAMEVVAQALAAHEQGKASEPSRMTLRKGENARNEANGRVSALSAFLDGSTPAMGMKWVASFPRNREQGLPRASALIILNSPDRGFPIAVMDGTIISAMRTGACTGIAARFLAPSKTRKIGIVGAGVQARAQLLGLFTALPYVEEIAVWNRTSKNAEVFVAESRARWKAPAVHMATMAEALADADVVVTSTTADEPIISARYIKPGALTIQLSGHECEFDLVKQCSKIVFTNWNACKFRGIRTPALMYVKGLLSDEDIYCNLGELLLGRKPGRETDAERIHFSNDGMGSTDVALAHDVFRRAQEKRIGVRLPLWNEPLWY